MTFERANDEMIEGMSTVSGFLASWDLIDTERTAVIRRDGEAVAVFGLGEVWAGLGQAWAMVDHEAAQQHSLWFIRETRRVMNVACHEFGYRQVRAFCFTYDNVRWTKLMGFETEGFWPEAGPEREDVFVMVYHRRH